MTSIVTTNISLVSTQAAQPALPHPVREGQPPTPQAAQQQLAQVSQVMAERNTSSATSQKRNTLNVQDRVQGKFAPQEEKEDGKRRVASEKRPRRKGQHNLDLSV